LGKGVYQLRTTTGSVLAKKHNINRLKVSFSCQCVYVGAIMLLSLQPYNDREAQDDPTQEEGPAEEQRQEPPLENPAEAQQEKMATELQQGQDLHGQEPPMENPAEQTSTAPHKEAPLSPQRRRKRGYGMSAAAQRAQKRRAKKRKLEQKEKTPPPIELSSDECPQDSGVWKTIEGVKLQEADR
jgi:hypothetical protein